MVIHAGCQCNGVILEWATIKWVHTLAIRNSGARDSISTRTDHSTHIDHRASFATQRSFVCNKVAISDLYFKYKLVSYRTNSTFPMYFPSVLCKFTSYYTLVSETRTDKETLSGTCALVNKNITLYDVNKNITLCE